MNKTHLLFASTAIVTLAGGVAMAADPMPAMIAPIVVAAPPAPMPGLGGALAFYGGAGRIDVGDDIYGIGGFNGAVVIPMGGLVLQLGGVAEMGIELDADTYGGVGFEAHLMRAMANGGFGLGTALILDQADDDWNYHGAAALEGGMQRGALGFGFQIGYIRTIFSEGNERLFDAFWARAGASVAFGAIRLSSEVAYYRGRFDDDLDPFRGFGAGAEVAFTLGQNFELFAAWDGLWHTDITYGDMYATHQFTGGLRVFFGDARPMADMPNFIRLNALMAENN